MYRILVKNTPREKEVTNPGGLIRVNTATLATIQP
jgi:hypothetical protein